MLKNMLFIIRPHTLSFTLALLSVIIVNGIMSLLNPFLLKYIFDEGVIKKDFKMFIVVIVGFILLATFDCLIYGASFMFKI